MRMNSKTDVQEFGFLFLSLRCSRRGRHYIIRCKVICGGLFNRGSKVERGGGGGVSITLPEFFFFFLGGGGWGFNPHPTIGNTRVSVAYYSFDDNIQLY